MDRADFHYELPPELIAQAPLAERSASRLLVVDGRTGSTTDSRFAAIVDWLRPGDLLVLNDTRVLPARLMGRKSSGGRVEVLLERVVAGRRGLFQVRASKSLKAGAVISLDGGGEARVHAREGEMFVLDFDRELLPLLETRGAVPLPPYIERAPSAADRERYQTVFARAPGAVAAPTAGLHFDNALLAAIAERGVGTARITLHVGAGTFSPVRSERIEDHRLHPERFEIGADTVAAVERTRQRGGRIVAVGTTTVRALESAARRGFAPMTGETDLFIYPGFGFRLVDMLVTNFHLPESSLLMLVAAFAGRETTLGAYRHAVAQRYRFFSYGDAMLLTSRAGA